MKRSIKFGIERMLSLTALDRLYVRGRQRGSTATILMYHSIAGPETEPFIAPANRMSPRLFTAHMRVLAKHRRPVSLGEIAARLEAKEPFEPGSVAVTFDDGYLDNLEVAAPVLSDLGIPATLYLPTSYIDAAKAQWADRLYSMLKAAKPRSICYRTHTLELGSAKKVRRSLRVVVADLIPMTDASRDAYLEGLAAAIGYAESSPRLTMTWSDVANLLATYPLFELGTHSATHADLTALDAHDAREEVRTCSERYRQVLGSEPAHFSFPYGRSTASLRAFVAECGYSTAVASSPEHVVTARSRSSWLPRIDAALPVSRLRYRTSGAYPRLSQILMRRA